MGDCECMDLLWVVVVSFYFCGDLEWLFLFFEWVGEVGLDYGFVMEILVVVVIS